MSLLMLDTSIASAIISQRVDAAAQFGELDQADWCISAITRAELQFGVIVLFMQIGALWPETQHPCGFPADASLSAGPRH